MRRDEINVNDLESRVLTENIVLHAREAKVYNLLNPQLFNFYNRKRVRHEVNFIVKELSKNKREYDIIDLGCGTGFLTQYFLETERCNITAVDLSPEMLEIFETRIPEERRTKIKIIKSEVAAFVRREKKSYDAVVMSALLHHLVNVEEFVRSSCQLVRRGGFYYIAFEPLKQEITSKTRFILHRAIRALDNAYFQAYLRLKNLRLEQSIADYQVTLGGIEPGKIIASLKDDFQIISLNKFCVRRLGLLALLSDSIVRSENTFSLIARRKD